MTVVMLEMDAMVEVFDQFKRSAFRLELLPAYSVDSDGADYQRWVAGEPEPTWERKNPWLAELREDTAAGRLHSRVKVMSTQPTDYERYAAEWGYELNAQAGEDIGILDLATRRLPEELEGLHDFWIFDSATVLVMHYDHDGRLLGGELAPPCELPRYLAAQNAAQAAAEPFAAWWARRPDLRRRGRVA